MRALLVLVLCLMSPGLPVLANDSMATLGAGGLVFIKTDDVTILSEDLFVSADEIRVRYEFHNEGADDIDAKVAFPLPDITGNGDFLVALPSEDPSNLFAFETRFNGEAVTTVLHQYAFATNIDHTAYLVALGIPLAPFGAATISAIAALGEAEKLELFRRGLVVPVEYETALGTKNKEYYPAWTLRTSHSWEAHFPAGQTVTVEHSYRPSVGGTVATTFLAAPSAGYDPAAVYKRRYCTDDAFLAAVERTLSSPEERYSAPFSEHWLSYIWSTGANWNGPIGRFHLTIDKGRPENLVSFCWDGEVTRTSPTRFEMEAISWWPPLDRELEILILERQDPIEVMEPNVG